MKKMNISSNCILRQLEDLQRLIKKSMGRIVSVLFISLFLAPFCAYPAEGVLPTPVQFDKAEFLLRSLGAIFVCMVVIIAIVWLLKGRPGQLSFQDSTILISFVFAALIATSAVLVIMLLKAHNHEDAIHEREVESIHMAFEIKQSSDDLARFARAYVATGNPKYEHYIREIIAIRDGRQPHPEKYTPFYWDYVAAGIVELNQDGEIYSIEKRITNLGLSEEERVKLSEAKKASDDLINLIDIAMNAGKGLYKDDKGRFTIKGDPDMAMARQLLYGKEYHETMAQIMKPIEQFFTLQRWENTNAVNYQHGRYEAIMLGIMILIVLTIGFSIYVFFMMRRRIILPLAALKKGAQTIKEGDYSHYIDLTSSDEIGSLADIFNSMARSIEENTSCLHATIESIMDGIIVVNLQREVTSYNTRFLETWHLDSKVAESTANNMLLDTILMQIEEPDDLQDQVKQLYANPEKEAFITLLLRDSRVLECYSKPQQLDDRIIGRVWSFRDITARHQADIELRKLSSAIEASPATVVITDTMGTIQYVNPKFSELTGYTAAEAIGQNPRILKSGIHPLEFYEKLWKTITDGNVWRGELCNRKKNGEVYWESAAVAPVKDEKGRISHFVAVKEDITERKQAEEDIKKAKEHAELLYKLIPSAIFTVDMEKRITTWNDQAAKITGYSAEEMMGRKCIKFALSPCTQKCGLLYSDIPKPIFDREVKIRRKDGQVLTIKKNVEVLTDSDGGVIGGIECFEDITERKQAAKELVIAKEQAETANIAKSTFLANMSHEIRTPLNAVLGFLELVLQDSSLSESQKEHLSTAKLSANSLLGLINDILDISKLERGKLNIEQHPFCISRLMHEIQSAMHVTAQEKGLYLQLDIQPSVSGAFKGDPLRLRQILINLVGNAIKFTKEGGVFIRVMPAEEEGLLHFMVEDTGIGIPAHRLHHIFKQFTQADASTTRRYGGTGLGTTIARSLVELMGGRIWVESEENTGSTFHFTINIPPTDGIPEDDDMFITPEKDALPRLRRGFRILLVEDVPVNVDLAKIRLEHQDQEVTVAWNGSEAVELFEPGKFDLILMDIQMPVMGGLEATGRIRAIESSTGGHVPIIAMTAAVMQEEAEKYLGSGMDAVVAKPIDFGRLFRTMEALVPEGVGQMGSKAKEAEGGSSGLELPLLDGIDIKKGIQVWHNPDLYKKELLIFSHNYSNAATELTRFIDAGELDNAYRLTHTLKGVAGNLSLTEVFEVITSIDAAIKDGVIDNVKDRLSTFSDALNSVINSIRQWESIEDKEEKPKKEMDVAHLKALFIKMQRAFGQYDPNLIEPFLHELETYFSQEQLSPIMRCMERFDFDGANQETVKFAQTIQIDLEGHNV